MRSIVLDVSDKGGEEEVSEVEEMQRTEVLEGNEIGQEKLDNVEGERDEDREGESVDAENEEESEDDDEIL